LWPSILVSLANMSGRDGAVFHRQDGRPYADHGSEQESGWT
jgi:hypothetical protein